MGLDNKSCKWFKSYLTDRLQCVLSDGVKSSFLNIMKDVPQGSVLEPVLLTIYRSNIGLCIRSCNIHLHADGTVMYAIALTVDQGMLELQSDFLKLLLNAGKTKYMLFSNSQENVSDGLHTVFSLSRRAGSCLEISGRLD